LEALEMNPRSLLKKVTESSWIVVVAMVVSSAFATAALPNAVPHLDPLVPAAAAPGGPAFTLTVTGTGFVSGSTVYWNGSPLPAGSTIFVSSSKLTAAIPAANIASPGTATVTVVSPPPGGGTSNFQFFLITTATGQQNWTFKDVTGSIPLTSGVVAGDFNGDGKLDLSAAIGPTVWVSLGKGDGTFQAGIPSAGPAGSTITAINVADVNGDGKPDVIVTGAKDLTTSFVATMLGNGDGSFQAPIESDFHTFHVPQGVVLADYDGDGILDLAFVSGFSIQTLLGNGDGTFRIGPSTSCTQVPLNVVATGDFNKDGKADLVVTLYDLFSTGFDFVDVFPGNGDGSFGNPQMVVGSGSPYVGAITAAVGDFNGDGNLDIATGIQTAGATIQGFIQIALGNGDGTFQLAPNVPNVVSVTTPLLVGDFNGDGYLDLVTGGLGYFGRGDGTFPTFTASSVPNPNTYVVVGDFNGDGYMDLVDLEITINGSSVLTAVQLTLQAPPAPDFTGIIGPFNSILVPGSSVSISATLHPLYGFTGDVVVGATDLPQGVTPSYNPVVVKGGSGSTTITLTAATTVALGNYTVNLTGNSGSITHTGVVPITVSPTLADWSSSIASRVQNTVPGGSVTYSISIAPKNGVTSGSVTPTITGLPPGVTATFNPALIPESGGTTTLTIQTSASTPQPQVYTMTLTGTDGVITHSGPLYLGVNASGGDFTGSMTPAQATTSSGAGVSYTLNYSALNGGAGDVSLHVDGVPGGAIGTFYPAVVPGGSGSSTLTVNTSLGTLPGTYPLVITSTGSGVMHLQYLTLVVTP
jgi:hypothetical protein